LKPSDNGSARQILAKLGLETQSLATSSHHQQVALVFVTRTCVGRKLDSLWKIQQPERAGYNN